jgi:hypothetical protein
MVSHCEVGIVILIDTAKSEALVLSHLVAISFVTNDLGQVIVMNVLDGSGCISFIDRSRHVYIHALNKLVLFD